MKRDRAILVKKNILFLPNFFCNKILFRTSIIGTGDIRNKAWWCR